MKEYDFISIGGGSGGIAIANRAAEYGAKSLIIEEKEVGGTCVNVGCVPKKITWFGAELKQDMDSVAADYGFDVSLKDFDYAALKKAREAYRDRTHDSYYRGFESRGTEFLTGHATFRDAHTLEVDGELYTAPHIAIVTGARPLLLRRLPGIELAETSNEFFTWDKLPKSVLIVGAGYIGMELSGILQTLGSQVTLAYREDRPMFRFDYEVVDHLKEYLEESGIELLSETTVQSLKKADDGMIEAEFDSTEPRKFEKVLFAIGRRPNTDNLGLENAGVELTKMGHVKVDEYNHTNVEGIYAIGDVTGQAALTPVAIKQGRTLADNLFGGKEKFKIDYDTIPTVMFTHPAIGKIGLSEEEAREKYDEKDLHIYTSAFRPMKEGIGETDHKNFFKLITLGDDEKIIGLWGLGRDVTEAIEGFAVAIHMGATKRDFDETVAIHPTSSEEFVTMR